LDEGIDGTFRDYLERVTRQPDVGGAEKAFDRVMRGMVVPLYLPGISGVER
jgi:hypothetical protein